VNLNIESGEPWRGTWLVRPDTPLRLNVTFDADSFRTYNTKATIRVSEQYQPDDSPYPRYDDTVQLEVGNGSGAVRWVESFDLSAVDERTTYVVEINGEGVEETERLLTVARPSAIAPKSLLQNLSVWNRGRVDETFGPDVQFHYPYTTSIDYDEETNIVDWEIDTNGFAHESFGGRREPVMYAAESFAVELDRADGIAWLDNVSIEFTGRPAYDESGDYVEGGISEQTWTAHVPQRYAQAYINGSVSKEQFAMAVYGTVYGNYFGAQRGDVSHDSREERRRFMAERMERELEATDTTRFSDADGPFSYTVPLDIREVKYLPERDAIVVKHRYEGDVDFLEASARVGEQYSSVVEQYGLEYAPSGGIYECGYDSQGLYHYMHFTDQPLRYLATEGAWNHGGQIKPAVVNKNTIRGSDVTPLPEDPVCQEAPLNS
jgi:hypothetical protein